MCQTQDGTNLSDELYLNFGAIPPCNCCDRKQPGPRGRVPDFCGDSAVNELVETCLVKLTGVLEYWGVVAAKISDVSRRDLPVSAPEISYCHRESDECRRATRPE